ncbi:hypothetical protein EXIGLDRAFT_695029 [Exidia glandulosa HHB12029]|uniref:Uncharacterized protein n=1 Tax=Exidia glandulosa HHB12029 TaxID=1314781 RepID=A0A165G666_EXIGL|nr:hypothetical protein EXIGLDRAFT_695029 [Exidia glandulosa HHB12029]
MTGEHLKSWPDPAVEGLRTRRQAAQEQTALDDSKAPTQKNKKQPNTTATPKPANATANANTKGKTKAKAKKDAKAASQGSKKDAQSNVQGKQKLAGKGGKTKAPAKTVPVLDADSDGDHVAEAALDSDGEPGGDPKRKHDNKSDDESGDNGGNESGDKGSDESGDDTDKTANTDGGDDDKKTDAAPPKATLEDQTVNDKWKELDFDLTFLDDDLLAAALEAGEEDDDKEGEESAPGPLSNALKSIWQRFLGRAAEFVQFFAKAARKAETIIWGMFGEWFKLTRNPNIYNMWVKQWSLLNEKEAGESKRDYHRRYVDAYHEKVDCMTPKEKHELRVELLNWLHSYEKECAHEAEQQGVGFKNVVDGKRAMIRTAQTVARKNNCVVWGVIAPLNLSDAKMISSGGSFSSHEGMTDALKELGVNADGLCGDISAIFGAKRIANRLVGNYSDEALTTIANKPEKDRRYYLRLVLLAIYNQALPIPTDKLDWKGNASMCVRRGMWFDKWPAGVSPPDVIGDNKYNEPEHNMLMSAAYKTMRKEPNYPHIEVKKYTDEELSWRRSDWKRWCALPVYRDTDGKVLIAIRDVMPSQEEDMKLKGRVSRKRFTGPTGNENVPLDAAASTTTGAKRPRRSEEEYKALLVGGGNPEYWQTTAPPVKRRRGPRPGYEHVEEMVSHQASVVVMALIPHAKNVDEIESESSSTASDVHAGGICTAAADDGRALANMNWQQQQQQQQQQQLPPISEWIADGQGGFMNPFGNGNC